MAPAQERDAPDGQESSLQQLRLPTEREPALAYTDQAEVEDPEEGHDDHVGGPSEEDEKGEDAPGHCEAVQEEVEVVVVRVCEPEQGRDLGQSVRQGGEPGAN